MLSVLSIFLSPFVFQQNIFVKSKLKYEFPFMFSIRSFLTLSISWMHLDIDLFHQCFQCILGSWCYWEEIHLQIESFGAILEKFSPNCGDSFSQFSSCPSFIYGQIDEAKTWKSSDNLCGEISLCMKLQYYWLLYIN